MNITITSGKERRARDFAKRAVEDAKRNRKNVAEAKRKGFLDKIGPAVEFAQDKARGKHLSKEYDAEEYRRHYFPEGFTK